MIWIYILLFIFIVLFLVLVCLPSGRHTRYRRKAVALYEKFNTPPVMQPMQLLAYLRKINPYVFEELIIYAFEKKGYKGVRNKRYSGDGGIDGRVKKDGKVYLLQAKRYSGYINPNHLADFASLCSDLGKEGFFVHTGRTGDASRKVISATNGVTILSGQKLYELLIINSPNEGITFEEAR